MKKEKPDRCDYCAQNGTKSEATHEITIPEGSMRYGTGAHATVARLCDECYAETLRS
jgi:hypothetical protein